MVRIIDILIDRLESCVDEVDRCVDEDKCRWSKLVDRFLL